MIRTRGESMGTRRLRTAVAILAFAGLATAALLAQSAPAPARDPLLDEIRALRGDMNQRLEATMRMQLLVARLQLQEQRTSTVLGQLRDVESRLRENEAAKQQSAAALKMLGMDEVPEAEKQDNPFFKMFAAGTEKFATAEAELKAQQAELARQLSQEQAQWKAFNTQLDQLEKLFPLPRK
jgi:hypothetical protein